MARAVWRNLSATRAIMARSSADSRGYLPSSADSGSITVSPGDGARSAEYTDVEVEARSMTFRLGLKASLLRIPRAAIKATAAKIRFIGRASRDREPKGRKVVRMNRDRRRSTN